MIGKIRRKQCTIQSTFQHKETEVICPICERPIPPSQKDAHHLVPKSKGGKTTQYLHRICHRQIHALFTETELAIELNNSDQHQKCNASSAGFNQNLAGFTRKRAKAVDLKINAHKPNI